MRRRKCLHSRLRQEQAARKKNKGKATRNSKKSQRKRNQKNAANGHRFGEASHPGHDRVEELVRSHMQVWDEIHGSGLFTVWGDSHDQAIDREEMILWVRASIVRDLLFLLDSSESALEVCADISYGPRDPITTGTDAADHGEGKGFRFGEAKNPGPTGGDVLAQTDQTSWKSGILCEKEECDTSCPSYHFHKRSRGKGKKGKGGGSSEEEKKKDKSREHFAKRVWRRQLKDCVETNVDCSLPGKYHPGDVSDPMDKGFDLNPLGHTADVEGITEEHLLFVGQLLKRKPELKEHLEDFAVANPILVSSELTKTVPHLSNKTKGKELPPTEVQPTIEEKYISEAESSSEEEDVIIELEEDSDPSYDEEHKPENSDSDSASSEFDDPASESDEDIRVVKYFADGDDLLGPPAVPAEVKVIEAEPEDPSSEDSEDSDSGEVRLNFLGEVAQVDVFSNLALRESYAKWFTFRILPFCLLALFGVLWCQRFDMLEDAASHGLRGRLHQFKHLVLQLPSPTYFEEYWWSFDPRLEWLHEERDSITGLDLWYPKISIWTQVQQTDHVGMSSFYFAALSGVIANMGVRSYVAISLIILSHFLYCSLHKWFWGPKRMLVLPGHLDNYIDCAQDNDWFGRVNSTRALHGCEATTIHRVTIYTELYDLLRAMDEFRNVQTTQCDGSFRPASVPRTKDLLRTFVLVNHLNLNPEWASNTVSYIVTQEHLAALHCLAKSPNGEERGILNGTGGRRLFQNNSLAGSDAEPSMSDRIAKCQSIVLGFLLPLILLYLVRRYVSCAGRSIQQEDAFDFITRRSAGSIQPIELYTDPPSLTQEWYTQTTTGTVHSPQKRESSRVFGENLLATSIVAENCTNRPGLGLSLDTFVLLMKLWSHSTSGQKIGRASCRERV